MIACKSPSALFWNIGSLGHERNVSIVTDTLKGILGSSTPEVVCFAEASPGSSAFTKITLMLTDYGYASEPITSTSGAKSIVMFSQHREPNQPTLTRDAIVGIRINQLWYLGFHFPRYSDRNNLFRKEFESLHEEEVAGPAIAIGDYNARNGYLNLALYSRLNHQSGDEYTYSSGGDKPHRSTIDAAFVRQQSHRSLMVSHDVKDWWIRGAGKWKKERLDHSYVLVSPS